jgi:hypothetical protein
MKMNMAQKVLLIIGGAFAGIGAVSEEEVADQTVDIIKEL